MNIDFSLICPMCHEHYPYHISLVFEDVNIEIMCIIFPESCSFSLYSIFVFIFNVQLMFEYICRIQDH